MDFAEQVKNVQLVERFTFAEHTVPISPFHQHAHRLDLYIIKNVTGAADNQPAHT